MQVLGVCRISSKSYNRLGLVDLNKYWWASHFRCFLDFQSSLGFICIDMLVFADFGNNLVWADFKVFPQFCNALCIGFCMISLEFLIGIIDFECHFHVFNRVSCNLVYNFCFKVESRFEIGLVVFGNDFQCWFLNLNQCMSSAFAEVFISMESNCCSICSRF